jgi:hypothetical protein
MIKSDEITSFDDHPAHVYANGKRFELHLYHHLPLA